MGLVQSFSSAVGKKMKDAQAEMMEQQMARQLCMQNEMRKKQIAMQLALGRERFWYYTIFVSGVATACTLGALITKNPKLIAPLWPLGMGYWFQKDMTSGVIMDRAIKEAEEILLQDPSFMNMPGGMPTVQEIIKKSG